MATHLKSLSLYDTEKVPDAGHFSFGIVVSEYNKHITFPLLEGAVETLLKHGCEEENIKVVYVPGAYELPSGAQLLDDSDTFDAILCLGCVIKGETDHDIYINTSVAQALATLSIERKRPFLFGLLTPNTEQQAIDRAGGKHGNKGVEVAVAAIKMADLARQLS